MKKYFKKTMQPIPLYRGALHIVLSNNGKKVSKYCGCDLGYPYAHAVQTVIDEMSAERFRR